MTDRLQQLEQLISTLRGPQGCPWDREQTLVDLRAYLLEEAHEVAAAIDAGDHTALMEELGDLLFQVVFIATLGEEAGAFSLAQVVQTVHDKMIERHPHVFGDDNLPDSASVRKAWEQRKSSHGGRSILAGAPLSLPALLAAYRMSQKVAGVGFDWPDTQSIVAKIEEELAELRREILHREEDGTNREATREEIGDLLFTVANLARRLEIDPEAALAHANRKFRRRFQAVEEKLWKQGRTPQGSTLSELDMLWNEVKDEERRRS